MSRTGPSTCSVCDEPLEHSLQRTVSRPVSVPVLEPNLSVSMPSRCSMLTYRLHNGGGLLGLKARCWPCLKPPPASRIGKFLVPWVAAFPRLLLKNTIVRSSKLTPSSFVCFSLTSRSRKVFIFSCSTFLSCSILVVSWQ